MLTEMTDDDWTLAVDVFRSCQSRRGDKGRDDRLFLEAMHYLAVHDVSWRVLPQRFGRWNSVWKRFFRLSRTGVFKAFLEALPATSAGTPLAEMFDSRAVRAHVATDPDEDAPSRRTLSAVRPRSASRATWTASPPASASPTARRPKAARSTFSTLSVRSLRRAKR